MSGQVGESPVLIAQTGVLQGTRWSLDREEMLIGRTEDCDLVVADRQVSRRHARIRRTAKGFMIEDLGSKNGTHINGEEIREPRLLKDGDIIQVALALKLIYIGQEATLPLSQEQAMELGLGKLRLDALGHRVWIEDQEIIPPLSLRQYRLLEVLYKRPGGVVSRDELVPAVWPGEAGAGVTEQAIDALVRRLREKLAAVDPAHQYIVTVRGHGFRLNNPI